MQNQEEEFIKLINRLRNSTNSIIIVEGNKDKKALEFWNIPINIEILIHPWFEFIETIMTKYSKSIEIILLLDADPQGREYMKLLKNEFRQYGYKVNTGYWIKIQRFGITCIEGLDSMRFQEIKKKFDIL